MKNEKIIFDMDLFRQDVKRKRVDLGLSMDKVIGSINISKPTFSRIETSATEEVSMKTFVKVINWLGEPVTKYLFYKEVQNENISHD